MEDLPPFQGLFVSKVSVKFETIDTDNNKTVGIENFEEVRGFGNTQDQTRRNALRSAAELMTTCRGKFVPLIARKPESLFKQSDFVLLSNR